MFEKFEIIKEKDLIKLKIKYKKKIKLNTKTLNMDEIEARRLLLESDPSLNIEKKAIKNVIADNIKNLEGEWQFRNIVEKKVAKKQQKSAIKQLTKLTEEFGGYEKELVTDLTSYENSATMEETTEKVQEPTE